MFVLKLTEEAEATIAGDESAFSATCCGDDDSGDDVMPPEMKILDEDEDLLARDGFLAAFLEMGGEEVPTDSKEESREFNTAEKLEVDVMELFKFIIGAGEFAMEAGAKPSSSDGAGNLDVEGSSSSKREDTS